MLDEFSIRIPDHVKALSQGFGRGYSISNTQCIFIVVGVIHHLPDAFILRLTLAEHTDVGQKNISILDLFL